jgi:hypothetical protein
MQFAPVTKHDTMFNHKSWHRVQSKTVAQCSITDHGIMFYHKPWHHVQSKILAPYSVTNRGTNFNHKSWHHVEPQIIALYSKAIHGILSSKKSRHHVQSQIMEIRSVTNHDTMLNHISWKHIQYMHDVLELLPSFYPRSSLGLPKNVLSILTVWIRKRTIDECGRRKVGPMSTCPNATLYTINPVWPFLVA